MDLNFYNENGYWIERDVLTPEECDALLETSKELENFVDGNCRPQMMPHRTHPIYQRAMAHPKIVKSISEMVGGTPVGLQTEFFYCKPGTRGFSLHQDNFFVEAPLGRFGSAWCALTDVKVENGALIAYPGTHKEGTLPVRKLDIGKGEGQDPNANNEETIVPDKYKPINAEIPRGSVFYIHGHLVHGSNPNVTDDKWRQVLLITYLKEGESFRPGRYARRSPIKVTGLPAEECSILPLENRKEKIA